MLRPIDNQRTHRGRESDFAVSLSLEHICRSLSAVEGSIQVDRHLLPVLCRREVDGVEAVRDASIDDYDIELAGVLDNAGNDCIVGCWVSTSD